MRKQLTRIGGAVAVAAGLGLGLVGTADAQIALGHTPDGPFQPPYSAPVDPDSVRIWSQIQGADRDVRTYGVFLGLQAR